MKNSLYVGLMSGTSVDSIDAAVVRCTHEEISIIACWEHPIPTVARELISTLSHSGPNEIEKMGPLDRELGQLFADATLALLRHTALCAQDITAIGSHGQTIRHRPQSAGHSPSQSFTLQIGDPNTIAELTGITTVADFRRRDIAAGGEGAPLVPAFHRAAFAAEGINRAVVNIGGIANASIMAGSELLMGFDTGPGNTLMDQWIKRHKGEAYDCGGNWAAGGDVNQQLLNKLLDHPYLVLKGPRSTGKEDFNSQWLVNSFPAIETLNPQCVQATLSEYTATTIAMGLQNCELKISEVYICGGGAQNTDLMSRLHRHLAPAQLETTTALGIDPNWVEAAAFAWLAYRSMTGLAGNVPAATGASGPRVLGGIYPA